MNLSEFVPERAKVNAPNGKMFSVRGLTLDDVSALASAHFSDVVRMGEMYQSIGKTIFSRLGEQAFLTKIIIEAPAVAANVIALACDEPQSAEAARRLPLPYQIALLLQIIHLTFEDFGGPKQFLAVLAELKSQGQEALDAARK